MELSAMPVAIFSGALGSATGIYRWLRRSDSVRRSKLSSGRKHSIFLTTPSLQIHSGGQTVTTTTILPQDLASVAVVSLPTQQLPTRYWDQEPIARSKSD